MTWFNTLKGQKPKDDPRIQGFAQNKKVESSNFEDRMKPEKPTRAMEEKDWREYFERFSESNRPSSKKIIERKKFDAAKEKAKKIKEKEEKDMQELADELEERELKPDKYRPEYVHPDPFHGLGDLFG